VIECSLLFIRCYRKGNLQFISEKKSKNEVTTTSSIPLREKIEKKISEPMPVGPIQAEEWPIQDASFGKCMC